MTQWTRTESGGYTAETPAGNGIAITKRGKSWWVWFRSRNRDQWIAYATRGAAIVAADDICQRERDEINALPGGGCG